MNPAQQYQDLTLTPEQQDAFLARIVAQVSPGDYQIIEALIRGVPQLLELIAQDPMTMRKLRLMIFGPKTEKTSRVCPSAKPQVLEKPKGKRKGHGRNKAKNYTGARWVKVPHPDLKAGDPCPECVKGKVREQKTPAIVLRITGSPPISATGYEMERLRCDACGMVFTAPVPEEAGTEKYDPSVGVTVAVLRYGSGVPHYRLANLQKSLGVPMPASTQWEVMKPLYTQAEPIWKAIIRCAANAYLIHQDDTNMRILDLRRPGTDATDPIDPKRTGTFTTNLLAYIGNHQIALYFTGWRHAGENLAQLLEHRAAGLEPPIQMCDALSRNMSLEFETILAHCLSHGRREFVSAAQNFPEECRYVLESLGKVYHEDARAKEDKLSPDQRLLHHQTHSGPVMETLQAWMRDQIDGKRVEPNSGLGQAITYMLKHWEPLTLFLRKAGAPLDNNICEQGLKRAILHRKNSLSYKTLNGARTGDLFMSLIHTCRLNGVNPFDYLMAIARNGDAIAAAPENWLPWNYPKTATPAADAR